MQFGILISYAQAIDMAMCVYLLWPHLGLAFTLPVIAILCHSHPVNIVHYPGAMAPIPPVGPRKFCCPSFSSRSMNIGQITWNTPNEYKSITHGIVPLYLEENPMFFTCIMKMDMNYWRVHLSSIGKAGFDAGNVFKVLFVWLIQSVTMCDSYLSGGYGGKVTCATYVRCSGYNVPGFQCFVFT